MSTVLRTDFERIWFSYPQLGELSGKQVFITGCAGFIGAYIVEFIAWLNEHRLSSPCLVEGVDNYSAGTTDRIAHLRHLPNIFLRYGDASSTLSFKDIFADYAIHLASIAAPDFYKRKPIETMRGTTLGIWNMLDWAVKVKPRSVVFVSSSEIYGDPRVIPTPEDYPGNVLCTGARSVYDESKRFGETLCVAYHGLYGVPVKIVRPHNIYGPGQRLDDGRVIPNLMRAVIERRLFAIYGDGSSTRSYCYISDFVVQLFAVLFNGVDGEPYNLGDGGSEASLVELVEAARSEFGGRPEFEIVPNAEQLRDAPRRRRPDTRKILQLAPKPEIGLREGLRRTLEYYLPSRVGRVI